jgi:hypothetical protein
MLEREAVRWLQLIYEVPGEPSQKCVGMAKITKLCLFASIFQGGGETFSAASSRNYCDGW